MGAMETRAAAADVPLHLLYSSTTRRERLNEKEKKERMQC